MKIYSEISLRDFEFWGGARETVKYLTDDEMNTIESYLEDCYCDRENGGMDETEINDFFWFEDNIIAEWLGYENFDEIMHRNEKFNEIEN